eukprot:508347_1
MAALPTPHKQAKMPFSHRYSLCVGQNHEGEFGIGNKKAQKQLIKCHWSENIKIRNIHTAYDYTIVEDMDGNYYYAGCNANGACTLNDGSHD